VRRRKQDVEKSPAELLQALPWAAVLQATFAIARRWRALSGKDRARLARLVRDSQGRVGNLSVKQRLELRRLVGKLDLPGLAKELYPLKRGAARGRGKRCRRSGA
jgi:hypothetical protein